jgi:adenylosuccinate lyase
MLDRYSLPEMSRMFDPIAVWDYVLHVERVAIRAGAALGNIPKDDALLLLDLLPTIDAGVVDEISARELVTDHDVAAFVDVMASHVQHPCSRWFHYGLTSSDVTDTAMCLRLSQATVRIITKARKLHQTLCDLAGQHRDTVTAGRTHGQHAEIITFGVRVANWALMLDRAIDTLTTAQVEMAVGKLSGACGTYSNIDPRIEQMVCSELGLTPVVSTQVIARDRHANLLYACARTGNVLAHIFENLRIMATTEFGEVREGVRIGQKGSSAMPHKRNPIKSEQIVGLNRLLQGYLLTGLQDVPLLMERDISHSAPERIALADALTLTHYMLTTATRVIGALEVDTERMAANVELSRGLMFSQTALTAQIDKGMTRDEAYRIIQELAANAMFCGHSLRVVMEGDPRIMLEPAELDRIFDTTRLLQYTGPIVDSLRKG